MKRAILCVTLLWATGAAASEPHAEVSVLFPKNVSRAVVFAASSVKDGPRVEWQVGELLRHSGRVEVIVPSAALGTPAGSAEEAVTKRAFNMPIDAVVLVRGTDAPMLVAVYRNGMRRGPTALELPAPAKEPKHEAPVASAATPAPAVASPKPTAETAAAPAPPASPKATTEPTAAPAPTPPPAARRSPEQAQAYYDASYIGFREFPSVRKTEPYEGRYQRLLQWPEFYGKIGRPDLVDRAQVRRAWQRGLIATGVIVTVGGLVGFIAQSAVNSCLGTDCHPGADGYTAGYVLTGAGLGFILGGSLVTTKVEPAWEARRLGEGYNAWLKEQLGVSK